MYAKKLIALIGAAGVAVLSSSGGALAASAPKVTVRIEGAKKTLLAPTTVQTHTGWITKDHTKKGACPATDAAGALAVATHGKWGGAQDPSFGLELTTIFGEKHTFSSRKMFWDIFINNKVAQAGICGLKLHSGDTLVFAATSQTKPGDLILIKAPKAAVANKPFTVKVLWLNPSGVGKPLAGAKVSIGHKRVTTNHKGTVSVKVGNPRTVKIHATHKGYIRAAPVSVRVSS